MNLIEFLQELSAKNVELWVDGEKLRYRSPENILNNELLATIKLHKIEIIKLLKNQNTRAQEYAIVPTERNAKLPLSYAQQRLWFLDQLEPNSTIYNISIIVSLEGQLNIEYLEKSLNEVINRHEALRTNFITVDGTAVQIVHPYTIQKLQIIDLRLLPAVEREFEYKKLALQEAQCPFNLSQEPLLRTKLIQLYETKSVLLLTMHHIVSDGWSLGILTKEIATLYNSFCHNLPSPLLQLPVQYADFAVWQRQWLQGERLESLITYWKKQLNGATTFLSLPTDRPRPTVQTFKGAHHTFVISPELTTAIAALRKREGVTLFMILLAAFKVLLYRYTNQEDILVGSPVANRNRKEVEGVIGLFLNTLVLRTQISNEPNFLELLQQVKETVLAAQAHQDLPFEMLVEALHLQRDLSCTPLFQVMFILQNAPQRKIELPNLTIIPSEQEKGIAMFDLTLSILETESGLKGFWEYNTDLFDPATIAQMAQNFQTLLGGIVACPEQPISRLPILTEWEKQKLLFEWNNTLTKYPTDKCFHQLFAEQVEKTPEAEAIIFEDQKLTYWELDNRANRVASYLQSLGVAPEVLVGICIERSLDMVVGLLGILKAGGAYVPLDVGYPQERLKSILSDSQVPILLTQKHLVTALPEHQAQVVCIDGDWQTPDNQENLVNTVQPHNLAYVIYTSGSTGQPKGVQITHQSLVNFLNSMRLAPELTNQDTLLAVTTISFDIAALELYLPLIVGARIVLASREVAADALQLRSQLIDNNCTVMQATPATWRLLLADSWQDKTQLKVICGGEALPRELAIQLLEKASSVWNVYGPTEATVWSTAYKVEASSIQSSQDAAIPIGYPIANTQLYILDHYLQPVPLGVPGELHIGGAGLARGYHNRPELTQAKFIPNLFSNQPEARLYKTGDLARYLPDGNVQFLGRLDHQVKIRGFRIELGEIESVLAQHPMIRQNLVVAREIIPGDRRLVGYIVPQQQDQVPTTDELRYFLKLKLPDYMIPNIFMMLEKLPLTPNGKIDRRALPAPVELRPHLATTYVIPQNQVEQMIAAVWQEALKLEKVGIYDNFFDLGGHSLLAVQIHHKLQKMFAQQLSLVELFQFPTIHSLAKHISQQESQRENQKTAFQKNQNRIASRNTRQSVINQQKQLRQKHRFTNK